MSDLGRALSGDVSGVGLSGGGGGSGGSGGASGAAASTGARRLSPEDEERLPGLQEQATELHALYHAMAARRLRTLHSASDAEAAAAAVAEEVTLAQVEVERLQTMLQYQDAKCTGYVICSAGVVWRGVACSWHALSHCIVLGVLGAGCVWGAGC